jgi:uncharacterized protein (TIGR02147 family)
MPLIKEYLEYRDFLKDFFDEKKAKNPFFSYRVMGKQVGIDASHLVKIFQKKRHIGATLINGLIEYCELKDRDMQYFSTLVLFNKAKSDHDSKVYYEKLLELKGIKSFPLEKNQYEFYTKWYYSAILTLLEFYPFKDDHKALSQKVSPAITEAQARRSIVLLEKLELIKRKEDGSCYLTNKLITTGDHCRSLLVRAYQEETIKLAAEALHRHPREKRNISTVTITISEQNLDVINGMIKEFREALLKYAEAEKNPDQVYQLNIQLFPLTI